jgi:hypothetical protein
MQQSTLGAAFRTLRRSAGAGALLLGAAFLATGCARQYAILTNSAGTIYCKGRPRLEHGYYVYRDASGAEARINELRVRAIEAQ